MNNPAKHAIRIGLAVLLAATFTSGALARPDTRAMTCAQTQELILRTGAIVLTTGRHTYDRYVAAYGHCARPYVPTLTYVRTLDTSYCPVYNCQYYQPLFED
jgi:hypothetical protein